MEIIFYPYGTNYGADFFLYQLKRHGKDNSCVVDFPIGSGDFSGLAFIFKKPNTLADITVLAVSAYKLNDSSAGELYCSTKLYADPDQYIDLGDLNSEYINKIGERIFSTESTLLERKEYLEKMLIDNGVISNLIRENPPKEFINALCTEKRENPWYNY